MSASGTHQDYKRPTTPIGGRRRATDAASTAARGDDGCRDAPVVAASASRALEARRRGGELLDDGLGDVLHGEATVHRRLLDPAEGLGLGEAHLLVEEALGAVDELAGLEALDEVADLGLERDDLRVPGECDLDGRQQVVGGERLDDVGEGACLARALDELLLAERGEEHDRCDVALREPLCRRDAVELRHLHVHDDEVGAQLGRECHRRLAVAGLSDDLVAVVAEDLDDVEADEGLVLRHDHAARRRLGLFAVCHAGKPTVFWAGPLAGVAEWQTRSTQNALPGRACGFDPHHRHRSAQPRPCCAFRSRHPGRRACRNGPVDDRAVRR